VICLTYSSATRATTADKPRCWRKPWKQRDGPCGGIATFHPGSHSARSSMSNSRTRAACSCFGLKPQFDLTGSRVRLPKRRDGTAWPPCSSKQSRLTFHSSSLGCRPQISPRGREIRSISVSKPYAARLRACSKRGAQRQGRSSRRHQTSLHSSRQQTSLHLSRQQTSLHLSRHRSFLHLTSPLQAGRAAGF